MIVLLKMCTSYFVHVSYLLFSFLRGVELKTFVRPQHFRGTKFVKGLKTPKVFIPFIQTLPNECSHIEDVHLLFCACFIIFIFIFEGC